MRWRIPIVVVLGLFVAVSCDQQVTEPMAADATEAPAFNFSNNDGYLADGKIFRHEHGVNWVGWDANRELIAVFTAGGGDFCALGGGFDPVDSQHVYGEASKLIQMGDVAVKLYDWTGLWFPFDCANYTPARYMGAGAAHLVTTDNDQFAFDLDNPNNNAWGFKANGHVDLVADGTTNLNYLFRNTWNPDKPNSNEIEKLNVSNDPR